MVTAPRSHWPPAGTARPAPRVSLAPPAARPQRGLLSGRSSGPWKQFRETPRAAGVAPPSMRRRRSARHLPSLLGPELRRAGPAPVSAGAAWRGRGAPRPRRALLRGPRGGDGQRGLRARPGAGGDGPGGAGAAERRGAGAMAGLLRGLGGRARARERRRGGAGGGPGGWWGRGGGPLRPAVRIRLACDGRPGRASAGALGRLGSLLGPCGLLKPHQPRRLRSCPVRSARGHR